MNKLNEVMLAIILLAIIALAYGFTFKWLWNSLMPTIFNLPHVGFWQAVGLQMLLLLPFSLLINKKK